jgi:transcriptional regulator with XRE-family HTH domain
MDISNFVKTNLKNSNLALLREIATKTGVPYNTLIRIKYKDVNPRIETIQPLLTYFNNK